MRKSSCLLLLLCLSIVLSLITCGCSVDYSYKEFESLSGGFAAVFPGSPRIQSQSFDSSAGKIEFYVFSASNGSVAFTVGYNDYPEDFLENTDAGELFDGARDGILNSIKGTVLEEHGVTLDGNAGEEVKIMAENGKEIIRQRTYLVGNRLFQISISTLSEEEYIEDINMFFDTFRLIAPISDGGK